MNPLTLEWIEKAEGDFGTAQRELSAAAPRNYDAVCFHAQQCAEKYLKAALQERMMRSFAVCAAQDDSNTRAHVAPLLRLLIVEKRQFLSTEPSGRG